MPRFNRAALLFSVNSFVASMLALYIGLAAGLPRPYWAMTTAYVVSQPLSGAVRSKAVYRVLGTLLGAVGAVVMVPNLVNAPVLLSLAMALWVGVCLTISLLDRTPRSYVMMLAGYTAAIIGFPSVSQPGAIFDVASARVIEIGLGIVCATLVHSLVFPRPVGDVLAKRFATWLADADQWAIDILKATDLDSLAADRRHLAAAASDIHQLVVHLPYDTSRLRDVIGAVRALQDRLLLLIPTLSGLSDRAAALHAAGQPLPAEVRGAMDAVLAWLQAKAPRDQAPALAARLQALLVAPRGGQWSDLLVESLVARMADTVVSLSEAHGLLDHINAPRAPLAAPLAAAIKTATRRPLHNDPGLAVLSGVAAAIAVLASCALWIITGWPEGAAAAILAAVFCCFFAMMDDPVPAIARFSLSFLASIPLSALYMFAILPMVDGFPMLCLVLAPPMLLIGMAVPDPKWSGSALGTLLGFTSALALQDTFSADLPSFLNGNLGQFVGVFLAIAITAAMRSMSVDASARRLVRQTWRAVADLAQAPSAPQPAAFAGRLVDRLGILTPKLAQAPQPGAPGDIAVDGLRDIRVGMNIVQLQQARENLVGDGRAAADGVLSAMAVHFSALAAGREPSSRQGLLAALDAALVRLALSGAAPARAGAAALTALRRNLFPQAPAPLLVAGAPTEGRP